MKYRQALSQPRQTILGNFFIYISIALANAYNIIEQIEQIEQINSSCNGGCRVKVDPYTKTIEPCTALYLSCRLFSQGWVPYLSCLRQKS